LESYHGVRVWNVEDTARTRIVTGIHLVFVRLVLGPMSQNRILRLVGYRYDIGGERDTGTPDSSIKEFETAFG